MPFLAAGWAAPVQLLRRPPSPPLTISPAHWPPCSQQQYFYRQLRCFLGPFLEKAEAPRCDARLTEDPRQLAAIEQRLLRGYCCGVEVPICTHLVGGTRVCHVRVNKAFHLLDDYLPNLDLLNVSLSDYLVLNVGLW